MRLRNLFLSCAAGSLILASCGGNENSGSIRQLGDYKDATEADSLIYYFGQLRAVDYWQYASQDTVMKTRESRDEYLNGLRAGLDATKQSDAYNQGLYVGIQLAMNMKEFQESYNCKFDRKILVNAIADGLLNDSIIDAGEANSKFREVLENMNLKKEEADKRNAIAALAEDAKAGKWTKISDVLYAGPAGGENKGGKTLTQGQTVSAKIEISTMEGRVIDIRPADSMIVGQSYPGPITDAVMTMTENESRTFYTTAPAIMGRYYERYNLKPTQIMKLTIQLGPAGEETADTPEEPAE